MKRIMEHLKKKRLYRYAIVVAILTVTVAAVYAATVPYTFTSGTVASSSEVNSNFSYLADRSWEKSGSNLYYSNGSIGIGTTSPGELLHVEGSDADLILRSTSASQTYGSGIWGQRINGISAVVSGNELTAHSGEGWDGSNFVEAAAMFIEVDGTVSTGTVPGRVTFRTQDTAGVRAERMRIDNSGKVGIGTTIPLDKLQVAGGISVDGFNDPANQYFSLRPSAYVADAGVGLMARNHSGLNYDGLGVYGYDGIALYTNGNNNRLHITQDGNIGIGTTSPSYPLHMASGAYVTSGGVWTNASSRTYKEHIAELTSKEAIAAFQGLKPVTYNYKVDKDEKHVGFIAEDVPAILATKDRKGVSPMDVVALLTKVVQEQQKTIGELKKEVAGLKKERM